MFVCTLHSLRLLPRSRWPLVCVYVCVRLCACDAWCCLVSLQGYDNTESSVRKASVFCLVAIYSVIGEDLKPHLAQLTGSKVLTAASLCIHTHTHTCGHENLFNRRRALSSSHVVISQQVWTGCAIIKHGVIFALLSLQHVSLGYARVEVWGSDSPEWRDHPMICWTAGVWMSLVHIVLHYKMLKPAVCLRICNEEIPCM